MLPTRKQYKHDHNQNGLNFYQLSVLFNDESAPNNGQTKIMTSITQLQAFQFDVKQRSFLFSTAVTTMQWPQQNSLSSQLTSSRKISVCAMSARFHVRASSSCLAADVVSAVTQSEIHTCDLLEFFTLHENRLSINNTTVLSSQWAVSLISNKH